MQTEFIGSKMPGNGGMPGEIGFKCGHISDVIDAFFKAPNRTRRQADPLHPQAFQFTGDVDVFGVVVGWSVSSTETSNSKGRAPAVLTKMLVHRPDMLERPVRI